MSGKRFFSKEISDILLDHYNHPQEETESEIKERMREITYLICHELTSQEIGQALFLSPRTIEKYRREILRVAKCKTPAGLLKFAMESRMLDDERLNKKFAGYLSKRKGRQQE